jgi:membrane-bound lytic murein transglycosylase F
MDEYSSLGGGKISPYDDIIRREAEKIGWDWRLIASLIYQESRFQSQVESWQGTYGMMQFTPETGARFGVYPDSPPEVQIIGGVKYIKRLFNFWKEIPDSTQRMKFTLASYNAGHGHILDAQRIAKHDKIDHLKWDDAVEEYLLKLSDPKYYNLPQVKAGAYRGKHTRNYVHEVFKIS